MAAHTAAVLLGPFAVALPPPPPATKKHQQHSVSGPLVLLCPSYLCRSKSASTCARSSRSCHSLAARRRKRKWSLKSSSPACKRSITGVRLQELLLLHYPFSRRVRHTSVSFGVQACSCYLCGCLTAWSPGGYRALIWAKGGWQAGSCSV